MLHKHLLPALFIFNALTAFSQSATDAVPEKKVDYLEKIYFSGKNKSDLTDRILLNVQQMAAKFDSSNLPSAAFLKQYVFLKRIEPQLPNAQNACDILDMIAVGIRDLDMEEAMAQKIKQPSAEAVQKSADALAGVSKVNNAISTTNSALNTLAWTNYLSSGNAIGLGALSKIGGVSNTLGAGLAAAEAGKELFGAAKSLGILKNKDKPCKDVAAKEITIGEHKFTPAVAPTAADMKEFNAEKKITTPGTIVTINNITHKQLSTLIPLVKKMQNVSDVSSDGFSNNTATLKINHTLELNSLLESITQLTPSVKLEVNASDPKSNSGILICKL